MSEGNLQELLATIGGVSELLLENPQTAELLKKLQGGEIPMEEGVLALAKAIEEEGLMPQMREAATEVEQLAPGFELSPDVLEKAKRPLFTETSTGIPQLNPLYEASLLERSAIDGDAPELRHGPLPSGGSPAVPVLTDAMDPVVVGFLLDRASSTVARQLEDAMEDHVQLISTELEATEQEARARGEDPTTALELKKKELPEAPTGVPGYLAGTAPELMTVPSPTYEEMTALTPTDRQKFAYKAIATTQGRTSLQRPILKQVQQALIRKGVKDLEIGLPIPVEVKASWNMRVMGALDIADNFAFPQVAVGVLVRDLLKALQEQGLDPAAPYHLDVIPINLISDRTYGWEALLGRRS